MKHRIPEATAPLEICWDKIGIPHIFAQNVEDAFRGMGYACASERLWQLHLSNLYATGTAASAMGEKYVAQDLMHRAFNVTAYDIPDSPGDYIVDAYLQGVNSYVDSLDEIPPEFLKAGTQPRHYTRHDVASRYRFTGWFQHKTWLEKIYLGKLMATHGVDWFRNHVLRFSSADADNVALLRDALLDIDLNVAKLLFPHETRLSGSNNWAVSAALSKSGMPLLAMDPHQPHTIPNTFFYSHLSAPGWDTFGASFPGVPYFMMGFNQDVSWGLTTGFVDTYDVFVERDTPDFSRGYEIAVAGQASRSFAVMESKRGPILESITDNLGITVPATRHHVTALDWAMRDQPTSAGILALMPLAKTSAELGSALFEADRCPLVNNIIAVDRHNTLHRYVAATLRKRPGHGKPGVTGVVPLPGWDEQYAFDTSQADELLVEQNPATGYLYTANSDTMGDRGEYPIHNFPTQDARARRIEELLIEQGDGFDTDYFLSMQRDLLDIRARDLVPAYIQALATDQSSPELRLAKSLLSGWDFVAHVDSKAACVFYPLLEKRTHIRFMTAVLGDSAILQTLSLVAPGLNRFSIDHFMCEGSPWLAYRAQFEAMVCEDVTAIIQSLSSTCGDDWRWGDIHKVRFGHSLRKFPTWQDMVVGPDPIGGSATTLAMATHVSPSPLEIVQEVYHGPAFRWVVDLADAKHLKFVTASGNGGLPDSQHITDHYAAWLKGEYFDLSLVRDELAVERIDAFDVG